MRDHESGFTVKDALVNMVFPRRCPVCDEIVPMGEGLICSQCRTKPQYIREPRCRRCGKQLVGGTKEYCRDCTQRKHVYDYGYALYDYQSMKQSIYRFKYGKRCEYAAFYAQDICERLFDEIRMMDADSIIPVPVHASRKRERGYNQAELVAAELSRLTGIAMYEKLVRRVRKTVPQKELTTQERQNNLKKAFNISTNVVKLNKTILVDDIYTTGSTLDAVALELKRHGVRSVYFIALCIGEGM
ncbi:MAG: ComF family protein [Lachnospiraceae bacterium]|nr:ComF family protein [Lachnospiraceae bacterium]